jgi:hypothetical protein
MKTAVEFMASELLYLDNEYNMKLINKNEYQAKRKEIIEQAKEMEKTEKAKEYLKGFKDGKEYEIKMKQLTFKSE